jgi:hypothetical protein
VPKSTDLAAQYRGVQETAGPNDGPVLKTIREALLYPGAPPCSWCALFVAWVLIRAYCPIPGPVGPSHKIWLRNTLGFSKDFLIESTRSWRAEMKALGWLTTEPCEGDLVIYLNHSMDAHHIALVQKFTPPTFLDIAGNTNEDPHSVDGNGVFAHTEFVGPHAEFYSLPVGFKACSASSSACS